MMMKSIMPLSPRQIRLSRIQRERQCGERAAVFYDHYEDLDLDLVWKDREKAATERNAALRESWTARFRVCALEYTEIV